MKNEMVYTILPGLFRLVPVSVAKKFKKQPIPGWLKP